MRMRTDYIGAKAAQTIYYAAEQAARIGLPLNHHITINFSSTKIDPRQAVPCFARLRRNHFNKWATRPRKGKGAAVAPTYVYAFENARGNECFTTMEQDDPHNVHVHWSVHIPAARRHDFESHLWQWVEEATGGIIGPEAINITALQSTHSASYLVKGAAAPFVKLYGRGQEAKPQGIILGRRAEASRNIGPSARRRFDKAQGISRQRRRYINPVQFVTA